MNSVGTCTAHAYAGNHRGIKNCGTIPENSELAIPIRSSGFSLARSDYFHNYFLVQEIDGVKTPTIVKSTKSFEPDFVAEFTKPEDRISERPKFLPNISMLLLYMIYSKHQHTVWTI